MDTPTSPILTFQPVIADILSRRDNLSEAIQKGHLTPSVSRYLAPGWAYLYKDAGGAPGSNPALAFAATGNALEQFSPTDEGSIAYVVTTSDEDRDGDIVRPMGGQLLNYARNPLVFFGHQEWEIPIGVCRSPDGRITVYPEEQRMIDVIHFDRADSDADFIYNKCKRKILNATSIAFVPIEAWRRNDVQKARTHSQGESGAPPGWYFNQWDKTEVSIVGVPSNPKAVGLEKDLMGACRDVLDREKSFMSLRLQKAWQPYCATPQGNWSGWAPTPNVEKEGNLSVKKVEKSVAFIEVFGEQLARRIEGQMPAAIACNPPLKVRYHQGEGPVGYAWVSIEGPAVKVEEGINKLGDKVERWWWSQKSPTTVYSTPVPSVEKAATPLEETPEMKQEAVEKLSTAASVASRGFKQSTGREAWTVTEAEFLNYQDPTNTRWQIGMDDSSAYKEIVQDALYRHIDIPLNVLQQFRGEPWADSEIRYQESQRKKSATNSTEKVFLQGDHVEITQGEYAGSTGLVYGNPVPQHAGIGTPRSRLGEPQIRVQIDGFPKSGGWDGKVTIRESWLRKKSLPSEETPEMEKTKAQPHNLRRDREYEVHPGTWRCPMCTEGYDDLPDTTRSAPADYHSRCEGCGQHYLGSGEWGSRREWEQRNREPKVKSQPSDTIDPEKACQILRDGTVNGVPITEEQRGMFGAACAKASKSYGGLRETCKALVKKSHLIGAYKEEGRKTALHDLQSGTTTPLPTTGDEADRKAWQESYDKTKAKLRLSGYWPGDKVSFELGIRTYQATVVPPGTEQGYTKVRIDSVSREGGPLAPGKVTNVQNSSLTKKNLSRGSVSKSAKDDLLAAFDRMGGSNNFVSLEHLRAAVPLGRGAFDQALNDLRREGKLTMSAAEGRHGITPAQRDAALKEGDDLLLYVSRRKSVGKASSGNVEYDQLKNRTREQLVTTLRNQGTITDMAKIAIMTKDQIIATILEGIGMSGPQKSSVQADIDSPGVPGRSANPEGKAGQQKGKTVKRTTTRTKAPLVSTDGRIGGYTVPPTQIQVSDGDPLPTSDTNPEGYAACESCHSSGNCDVCGGDGEFGGEDCVECGGSGECGSCAGEGHMEKSVRKASGVSTFRDSRGKWWVSSGGRRVGPFKTEAEAKAWIVDNPQWLGKSAPRRKQDSAQLAPQAEDVVDIQPTSKGEDRTTDEEQPSLTTPQVLAALYSHAKAEAAYIDQLDEQYKDALADYRADQLEKRMEHLKDMFGQEYQAALDSPEDALEKLCKEFEGEYEEEKGMESTGPDSTMEPGEAGLVEQGQIPETEIEDDMSTTKSTRRKTRKSADQDADDIEKAGDPGDEIDAGPTGVFNKAEPGSEEWTEEEATEPEHKAGDDEEVVIDKEEDEVEEKAPGGGICMCGMETPEGATECPGCGAPVKGMKAEDPPAEILEPALDEEKAEPFAGEETPEEEALENKNSDPAAEEILERYQHPKSAKWATRKWLVNKSLLPFLKHRVAANGKKYLVRAETKASKTGSQLRAGDSISVWDGEKLPSPLHINSIDTTSGGEMIIWTSEGKYPVDSSSRFETKSLTTKLAGAIDDLKALATAKDLPRQYKACLKHVADQIWYVGKALTDKGKEQKNGGKGSELNDKGKVQANGKGGGELKDKGEQQGKSPSKSYTNGTNGRTVSPVVEQKMNELMDKLRRNGLQV